MKKLLNKVKDKFKENIENDNAHIMDRMADFSYGMTTKTPIIGKKFKTSLDKFDTLNKTKAFASKNFKPFFYFPKIDQKYTSFFVNDAPKFSKK